MSSISQFENLPNELIFELFVYFDVEDLFRSFWNLNERLNKILKSLKNLSMIIDDKTSSAVLQIFAEQIQSLIVKKSIRFDFRRFVNVENFQMTRMTNSDLEQIRSDVFPHLVDLRLSNSFHCSLPNCLLNEIFNNGFSSLRRVRLGRVDLFCSTSNFSSDSIEELEVILIDPNSIPQILQTCRNLRSFNVNFLGQNQNLRSATSSNYDHPLKSFQLRDPHEKLSSHTLNVVFLYMPHLHRLELQFCSQNSILDMFLSIERSFDELEDFRCDIVDISPQFDQSFFDSIRMRREYFHDLQFDENVKGFRRFFTD